MEASELEREERKEEGPKEKEWELLGMNSGRYGDGRRRKEGKEEEDDRSKKWRRRRGRSILS